MYKVILITGGTSGLGLAMATSLANGNNRVYATGRNIPVLSSDNKIIFKIMDVQNENSVNDTVKSIIESEKRIDVLINSAGVGMVGSIEEVPFDKICTALDVNYLGTIRVIKQVIPVMRKNRIGLIVNISSIGGRVGLPFQSIYTSSKFAVESLTEALRIELRPFGIRVCMIEPGDYNTRVNTNRLKEIPNVGSPYHFRLLNYFETLESKINKGSNPRKMGKLIVKIVDSKNIKLRYISGKFFEHITPMAKNILPTRLFEYSLEKFYKI